MAKRVTTKCNLSLNLGLFVLLNFLGTAMLEGTDSLSCTFTVKYRSSPGQCSVNGKPLLRLMMKDRTHLWVNLKKGNATKVCADLNQSLKDIFQKMMNLSQGNHTLQVTVQSQYNQGEFMDGRWAFTIDRQYPFYFYPKNLTWRESHPDACRTVSQWQNNREVAQSLRTCSMGDFSQCLRKLLTDSREVPSAFVVARMVKKKLKRRLSLHSKPPPPPPPPASGSRFARHLQQPLRTASGDWLFCFFTLFPRNPEGAAAGTDSLSCTFTVKYRSSPGQCSVNGKPLLRFDDERQNSPVGKPEKKGNATKVCADLNQSLKDIFQKMMNLESGLCDLSKGEYETECKDRGYK
ncbi:LOW QUALITY PROTEIN: histocompatibility antigen 60b-like [Rattus rattus]|uniref:LOW QUALITY PROTEIN: histocompatibility antigen 60b-like n=1 Tax=Rattus rattus TaxID=10117 RepID=UPI0013F33BBE|nr:LOW QUALITY PROTEIN: histocompatibility antigen 60b-like [Rattus rattus]